MADDGHNFIKEIIHIAASWRVRNGGHQWRSLLLWGLPAAGAIFLAWRTHPIVLLSALIPSVAFILSFSGYCLYRRWRKKLATSSCPACSAVIGRKTMALAFSEHARECREFSAGYAFVDFPGPPGLVFRCPHCDAELDFTCREAGDLSLWVWEEEDPGQEATPSP